MVDKVGFVNLRDKGSARCSVLALSHGLTLQGGCRLKRDAALDETAI
jgi:hypothetical protein